MKKSLLVAFVILALVTPSLAHVKRARHARSRKAHAALNAAASDGCDLPFAGSSRKAVKLRAVNLNYTFNNGGRAISVKDWFALVCPLDAEVPARKSEIPEGAAMKQEKLKVKVKAFVMAFKRDPDNDLHVQIADAASPYEQTQLLVEIPPGAEYCGARTSIMDLMRADGGQNLTGNYIFKHPPQIEVTGYLFLDAAHIRKGSSDYCTDSGGRGIKNKLPVSPVRGLWEIHPVISLTRK